MATPTTSSSMDLNHSIGSSTSSPTSYDNVIMTTSHQYIAQSSTKTITDESYDIDNDSFRSDSLSDVSDIDTSSQNVAIQTSEQLEKTYHSSPSSEVPTKMAITDVYESFNLVSSTSSASPVSINITSKPVTTSFPTVAASESKTLSFSTHSPSTSVSNSTSPHTTVPSSSTSPSISSMPSSLATSPSLPSSSPSSSSLSSSLSSTLLTALLSLDEDYNGNEMVVDESVFLYSSDGDENENALEFDESVLHSNLETNHVLSSSLIMQLSSSSSVSLHGNVFYLSLRINLAIAWIILITLSLTLME